MSGKIAIVTGAGSGIGRASALALLNTGYKVALAGRRKDALEETAKLAGNNSPNALAVPTDVTKRDDIVALFAKVKATWGRLEQSGCTAPHYRFYALPGGPPHRPGLLRVADGGAAIELEIWSLPASAVGAFLRTIPAPLGLGSIALADGSSVTGFLCESHATSQATDITALGGWRAYLRSLPV